MHYRQIVILVTCCLVAFGIYSLPQMQKNEFPDFTIRQGMVIAVAPGNTVNEMVEQVTKPLEDYIFSYKEVKKEKTFSTTRDGIVFVQVELNDELNNKDEFWSKFKHGVATFKSQLPPNVLAIQVMDDFGDTSALLITMESKDKTYRELSDYMDELKNRLRRISSVGRLTVSGERAEQVSIYLDPERLSHYGLNEQLIAGQLFAKGFVTTGGRMQTPQYVLPVHVEKTFNTLYDVQQQIVYSDPLGNVVRLQDVARVVKEYPHADSYIKNNGTKCILLSVEMKKGKNIVQMGNDIDRLAEMTPAFSVPGETVKKFAWIIKPVGKFLNRLTFKKIWRLCKKESGLKKADIADIADNKVVDFILELVQNLYCGDSPYTPDTKEYKLICGILNIIDSFLNTIHLSIGKFLKGATSVRGLVEPLLWNPGYCDAEATLPLYPIYDDENPAPKEIFDEKEFKDPVKKSKKGPLVLLILILLVVLILAVAVGLIALVVWAVIAIIHAISGTAMLGLLFS